MAERRTRVSLLGGTGYGGAELLRHLLFHPAVEVVKVGAIDHIGQRVGDVHYPLAGCDLVFEEMTPREAATGVDLVFLGVPHRVAATLVPELLQTDARVIDLSGDFRLRDADVYARYYKGAHPAPELLDGTFVYGLPELNRAQIVGARYVASPGCFATTLALALLPAARAGLLNGAKAKVVAMTGSSGSGQTPKIGTHHPLRVANLKAYRALDHQHMPEIVQTLEDAGAVDLQLDFVPVSAPLQRGILAVGFVDVPDSFGPAEAAAALRESYADEPFVRVTEGRLPEVVAVKGSMYVEVGGSVEAGTWAVVSAADNLVKGGAGQAIQSMNLMLGLPETLGLDAPALWP